MFCPACSALCDRDGSAVMSSLIYQELNEDSGTQRAGKSYRQPESIPAFACKPKCQNAQKVHHGSEKSFQLRSHVFSPMR